MIATVGLPQLAVAVKERFEAPLTPVCPAGKTVVPRPAPAIGGPPAAVVPPAVVVPPVVVPPSGGAVPAVFGPWQGPHPRIAFERDQMKLARGAAKALDELAVLLKANPDVVLTIEVHSDSRRPAAEAQVITENQAETARAYLLGRGVRPEQVEAAGMGSPTPPPGGAGDAQRRVELSFR